ncbi:protein ELC isoform X1 [Carica papaya]|uniref:protein ELC isoform X1 n=1 Tax=Carica papaya TaxID=3649 RepID=UPI000B8CDB8A|nr:protein ELC isoform X1 [Carica papaya]
MAPSSPIKFIEKALIGSSSSSFTLSYSDPEQKWIIRRHLLSLLQNYPNFKVSADTFNHNDGTSVNLLNVRGFLKVSKSNRTPPIPLTLWLHQNYPYMPPIAFISSPDPKTQIHANHPFVDTSGAVTPPYLSTWEYPRCSLVDFVNKLVKIFACDHPFACSSTPSFSHHSLVSKSEALDRLIGMLHYDMLALKVEAEEEIEGLARLQVEMNKRVRVTKGMISELEKEGERLNEKVMKLGEDTDKIMKWVSDHERKSVEEDAFEADDESSKAVIDSLAADIAIDDLMYSLDKAVEDGVITFDLYMKQVRTLGREQFFQRIKHMKIEGI